MRHWLEILDRRKPGHRRAWRSVALVCGALLATACGPVGHGSFEEDRYTAGYGYEVAFQKGTKRVLPEAWSIENFYFEGHRLTRKLRDRYVTTYDLDDDGDGVPDRRFEAFTFELRYEHSRHSGVIWLRSIPVSWKLRSKDLRVLMQAYIDEISGATYETVRLGAVTAPVVVEHRQTAMVVEEGPATMAGRPAYVATIDVADVDQIKLVPGARSRRVQLVLARAPKEETHGYGGTRSMSYPVIVLAGYASNPRDFETGLADFRDFLQRVTIEGTSGLTLHTAPSEPSVPPSPAAPSTAPAPAAPSTVPAPAAPSTAPAPAAPAPAAPSN